MGNNDRDDGELWARSLAGEGEAFGVLYDRHRDRVFRHAYGLSGNRHDAEDILSAAFFELWRRRSKVRLVENTVLPWLLVTTTNVARNSRRAAFRYSKLLLSLPRGEAVHIDKSQASFAEDAADMHAALALRSLNPTDMRLLSLVVFEEHSLAAAAAILHITRGAAKTRMHRARRRMRAAITEGASSNSGAIAEGNLS
ncbi:MULTISPECIES: RNA polymerase sigma factor [Cryobacterium]|uniref:RNA polymerase sigma factor n=1 Tax=Cryobacterium TaxID=69578 RepID=UPI000CD44B26|nr:MULTISPECIES: sigma-70 family RNA polymerase sigma factor [Cryobacterium]POH66060.1 sigma-70 family RNA polymerase sigma factor [Cryobacterium zongtaii]TFC46726.1 sigma-70 family RNA polymerase sigma factor [Cryobacterium sp. TMN-39-2]